MNKWYSRQRLLAQMLAASAAVVGPACAQSGPPADLGVARVPSSGQTLCIGTCTTPGDFTVRNPGGGTYGSVFVDVNLPVFPILSRRNPQSLADRDTIVLDGAGSVTSPLVAFEVRKTGPGEQRIDTDLDTYRLDIRQGAVRLTLDRSIIVDDYRITGDLVLDSPGIAYDEDASRLQIAGSGTGRIVKEGLGALRLTLIEGEDAVPFTGQLVVREGLAQLFNISTQFINFSQGGTPLDVEVAAGAGAILNGPVRNLTGSGTVQVDNLTFMSNGGQTRVTTRLIGGAAPDGTPLGQTVSIAAGADVVFDQMNSYAGPTIIAGQLTAGAVGALPAQTIAEIRDGGQLIVAANQSLRLLTGGTSARLRVEAGSELRVAGFGNGFDFFGTIAGGGQLRLVNDSTVPVPYFPRFAVADVVADGQTRLQLIEADRYETQFRLSPGTQLTAASGSSVRALRGSGRVDLGTNLLSVDQFDMEAGGILAVTLTPTNNGALYITQGGTINGTLEVTLTPDTLYRVDTEWDLLLSDVALAGTPQLQVPDLGAVFGLEGGFRADRKAYTVALRALSFVKPLEQTRIEQSIARSLDEIQRQAVRPAWFDALQAARQNPQLVAASLSEADPAPFGDFQVHALDAAQLFTNAVAQRPVSSTDTAEGKARGQVWARGIGLWGSSGNARQTDVSGVAGGFSLTLGHLGEAGIAAGYMDASLRAPGSTDTDGTMSTVSVSGFGRITVAGMVIDALVGYQDGKAREFVRGVGERRGKPDTQSWFADFGVGLPLASGSWQWLPRLGLRYAAAKLPNFTDSGGLIGPATIRADRLNATYFTAGFRTQWRPGSPASSMHVFADAKLEQSLDTIKVRLQGQLEGSTLAFAAPVDRVGTTQGIVAAGVAGRFGPVILELGYQGQLRTDAARHGFSGMIALPF